MPYRKTFKDTLYSKEWLCKVYVEEDRNAAQVAEMLGCTNGAVLDNLRKFGIPIKDGSEAQKIADRTNHGSSSPRPRKKFLATLHNSEWMRARTHLNASEIAREAGCSVPSAQKAMAKVGLAVPGISEAKAGRPALDKRKKGTVTRTTSHRRATVACPESPCVICGGPGEEVNHKDYNWQNDDPLNLERLCKPCHKTQHSSEAREMRSLLAELEIPYIEIWRRARDKIQSREYMPPRAELGALTIDNQTKSIGAWARESRMNEMTLRRRLLAGWDPKRAVTQPVVAADLVEFEGVTDTVAGHARRQGINVGNVYSRIHQGWSLERALTVKIRE